MANTTIRGALSIHGTNPQVSSLTLPCYSTTRLHVSPTLQYLIEKVIRSRVYDSLYWSQYIGQAPLQQTNSRCAHPSQRSTASPSTQPLSSTTPSTSSTLAAPLPTRSLQSSCACPSSCYNYNRSGRSSWNILGRRSSSESAPSQRFPERARLTLVTFADIYEHWRRITCG